MHITILLLLSRFFFWPSFVDWQVSQMNVVVRGMVVDDQTGIPISGAVVYALSNADVARTSSDANGNFYFLTLLPATYRLCASKSGYALDCYPRESEPQALHAGFEYGATVLLSQTTN
jgi:hypothetical protein